MERSTAPERRTNRPAPLLLSSPDLPRRHPAAVLHAYLGFTSFWHRRRWSDVGLMRLGSPAAAAAARPRHAPPPPPGNGNPAA
jgi:hypothetical protein